ncbi:uncharacterized protein LOC144106641 isoform X1 [Amblyomma americanum]
MSYTGNAMPDPGEVAAVHRLRGHLGGVNWRPTRFAEGVPLAHVCGLCRAIPKGTVLLPCAHFLCETCLGASRQDDVAVCPLDLEPYEEEECQRIHLPARKASRLRAHCWNEAHGCQFVGTMEAVLRHFEEDCVFHAVECPRCGEAFLHKDLPTHYMAGCTANTPSPSTELPSGQDSVLTIRDVNTALADLKELLSDPHHEQLLAVQSQINELVEHSRNQTTQLKDTVAHGLVECERRLKDQVAQISDSLSSTVRQELLAVTFPQQAATAQIQDNLPEAAAGSETIPWSTEKKLILRKLEVLASASFRAAEQLRHSVQPHPPRPVLCCERILHLWNMDMERIFSKLPMQFLPGPTYRLTLRDADALFETIEKTDGVIIGEVTNWYRRDTFITVVFFVTEGSGLPNRPRLKAEVRCHGLLQTSRLLRPVEMVLLNECSSKNSPMWNDPVHDSDEQCVQRRFWLELGLLKEIGFLQNGAAKFSLLLG